MMKPQNSMTRYKTYLKDYLLEMRRRRKCCAYEWRKLKRTEVFLSHRKGVVDLPMDSALNALLEAIANTDDDKLQLQAARSAREMLNAGKRTIELIRCGILPILIGCLQDGVSTEVKCEVIWCLGVVANTSPERSLQVLQAGALKPLLLQMATADLFGISKKLLRCIMFDDDTILRTGPILDTVLKQLLELLTPTMVLPLARSAVWLLEVLCFPLEPPLPDDVVPTVLIGLKALMENENHDVVQKAVAAVVDLVECSPTKRDMLVASAAMPLILELLGHEHDQVSQMSAFLVNQLFLKFHVLPNEMALTALPHYGKLIDHPDIESTAAAFLVGFAKVGPTNVQAILDKGFVKKFINTMNMGHRQTFRSVCAIIGAMIAEATPDQMNDLSQPPVVRALCKMIDNRNPEVVHIALKTMHQLLKKAGTKFFEVTTCIDDANGWIKMERLRRHKESTVFNAVRDLLEEFQPHYNSILSLGSLKI